MANFDRLRQIPLPAVLERLGWRIDPKDRHNYRDDAFGGRLTIDSANPEKFYVHTEQKGGGGAIDLAKILLGADFRTTIKWLEDNFGSPSKYEKAMKKRIEPELNFDQKPFEQPKAVGSNWQAVRSYLVENRCIDASLVDQLHAKGQLYADRYRNAVFLLGTKIQGVTGAELRGTRMQIFHGVIGKKGPFCLRAGQEKKVAFVESAIDALSLASLGIFKGLIISTTGSTGELGSWVKKMSDAGFEIFAAFDNDKTGNDMSSEIAPCQRMTPAIGKDWNEMLIAEKSNKLKQT